MAKSAIQRQYFTSEKAVQELNLPQNPIEIGMQNCMIWFMHNGMLK